jgi:hypothetical protein
VMRIPVGASAAASLMAATTAAGCPLSPNLWHCDETRGKHAGLSSNLGQNRGERSSRPSAVDAAVADCPRLDENPCAVDSHRTWGTAGQTVQRRLPAKCDPSRAIDELKVLEQIQDWTVDFTRL